MAAKEQCRVLTLVCDPGGGRAWSVGQSTLQEFYVSPARGCPRDTSLTKHHGVRTFPERWQTIHQPGWYHPRAGRWTRLGCVPRSWPCSPWPPATGRRAGDSDRPNPIFAGPAPVVALLGVPGVLSPPTLPSPGWLGGRAASPGGRHAVALHPRAEPLSKGFIPTGFCTYGRKWGKFSPIRVGWGWILNVAFPSSPQSSQAGLFLLHRIPGHHPQSGL